MFGSLGNESLGTSESKASTVIRVEGHCLQFRSRTVYFRVTKYCKLNATGSFPTLRFLEVTC